MQRLLRWPSGFDLQWLRLEALAQDAVRQRKEINGDHLSTFLEGRSFLQQGIGDLLWPHSRQAPETQLIRNGSLSPTELVRNDCTWFTNKLDSLSQRGESWDARLCLWGMTAETSIILENCWAPISLFQFASFHSRAASSFIQLYGMSVTSGFVQSCQDAYVSSQVQSYMECLWNIHIGTPRRALTCNCMYLKHSCGCSIEGVLYVYVCIMCAYYKQIVLVLVIL